MHRKKVVIIGSGQHGNVVHNILKFYEDIEVISFIDDDESKYKKIINNIEVSGTMADIGKIKLKKNIDGAIIAIGRAQKRIDYKKIILENNIELINCIHPKAIIDPDVKLGKGIVIDAGAVITPNSIIEDLVIINPLVSVNHDNILRESSHLAAGVALGGDVIIGKRTLLGIGASVAPGIRIGEDCIIGVGAAIMKNVNDFSIMVGNPARLARKRDISEII